MARDNKMLGNFILDGIAPGRRGQAKIEVSFDIDANGIVSVTAKDQTTGKEQKITITATTNLTKEDIDRMVKEAESHAKDDERAKEKADMRNDADALIYAVEKHVADFGSANSDDNKAKAEKLSADLRQKIKDNVDNDALKRAIEELRNQLVAMQQEAEAKNREPVGATAGGASGGSASGGSSSTSSSSSSSNKSNNDDVVDAEVV
jgi:molecular chaperone DnaK